MASTLKKLELRNIVLDPVLRSSSGAVLLDEPGLQVLRKELLPLADVVTPNLDEAAVLAGIEAAPAQGPWEEVLPWLRTAAAKLHSLGSRAIVITGGHLPEANDYLSYVEDGAVREEIFPGTHIESGSTHGTGCAFAMSIACQLALGQQLPQAVRGGQGVRGEERSRRLTRWARGLGRSTTWYRLDGGSGNGQERQAKLAQSHAAIRSFFLDGPAGRLEALLNVGSPTATHAGLVCHPHPMFGGTMHNKVVFHAMKALHSFGFPVLRFNFRGTGLSAGQHDDGRGEVADVQAALAWLKREFGLPVVFAGFSFGAATGLRACCPDPDVRALISLGTPVAAEGRVYSFSFLRAMLKAQALRQRRPRPVRPARGAGTDRRAGCRS